MSSSYIILDRPGDYQFFSDESFPDTVHNFKLIFALFLFLFWLLRNVLRYKESAFLSEFKETRNIVCVTLPPKTAKSLTRDQLLRFIHRLYQKEHLPCGKVQLPATIRKESLKTAIVFPEITQNDFMALLEQKYTSQFTPKNDVHTPQDLNNILISGRSINYECDNDTTLGKENEPSVLITFFTHSQSDSGCATIFPYLGVKTTSLYHHYDKNFGVKSQGVYLVRGNGLYPSRSKYQHASFKDIPTARQRHNQYREEQLYLLRKWLEHYKKKKLKTQTQTQTQTQGRSTGTTAGLNITGTNLDDLNEQRTHRATSAIEMTSIATSNPSDDHLGIFMPNQDIQTPDFDTNEPFMDTTERNYQDTPLSTSPNTPNQYQPFDDTSEKPTEGHESERERESTFGQLSPNATPLQSPSSNTQSDSNAQNSPQTDPLLPPEKVPRGPYGLSKELTRKRVEHSQSDPRYARSGTSFAVLQTKCPVEGIKAMQALPPIIVQNSSTPNGTFASIKIPLTQFDQIIQQKYSGIKSIHQEKRKLQEYQEQHGKEAGNSVSFYDPKTNNDVIPLVFVVTGTVGDAVVSEVIHFDFPANYSHNLYPQRHYLHPIIKTDQMTTLHDLNNKAQETLSSIQNNISETNTQLQDQDHENQSSVDVQAEQSALHCIDLFKKTPPELHYMPILPEHKTINQYNFQHVVQTGLLSKDLYSKLVTTHSNPDALDDNQHNSNSILFDTRLPLPFQLLRSGRSVTPLYQELYDLRRPVLTTIETGLAINTPTYNNYMALFPTFGLSQEGDDTECTICYSEPKRVILLPCRHIATCTDCALQLSKCCLCRSDIQSTCAFMLVQEGDDEDDPNQNNFSDQQLNATSFGPMDNNGTNNSNPTITTTTTTTTTNGNNVITTTNEDGEEIIIVDGIRLTQQQYTMHQWIEQQRARSDSAAVQAQNGEIEDAVLVDEQMHHGNLFNDPAASLNSSPRIQTTGLPSPGVDAIGVDEDDELGPMNNIDEQELRLERDTDTFDSVSHNFYG